MLDKNNFIGFCKKAAQRLELNLALPFLGDEGSKYNNFNSLTKERPLEIVNDLGDFLLEIDVIKNLAISQQGNISQPPTQSEIKIFGSLAKDLIYNNINSALKKANAFNYEIVRFFDSPRKQVLYGLREKRWHKGIKKGWGAYFINVTFSNNVLIEIPDILVDNSSVEIAAKNFLISGARGFLIAGGHFKTNSKDVVNSYDSLNSIFQEVRKAWFLPDANS